MTETWDLIREAVIARATQLALRDVEAQYNQGEFPEFHLDECLKQSMREMTAMLLEHVEELQRSEKHSPLSIAADDCGTTPDTMMNGGPDATDH